MSLADELLKEFEPEIESLILVTSGGGRFEVTVNGELIFSKLKTGRHPESGEVLDLVRKISRKN